MFYQFLNSACSNQIADLRTKMVSESCCPGRLREGPHMREHSQRATQSPDWIFHGRWKCKHPQLGWKTGLLSYCSCPSQPGRLPRCWQHGFHSEMLPCFWETCGDCLGSSNMQTFEEFQQGWKATAGVLVALAARKLSLWTAEFSCWFNSTFLCKNISLFGTYLAQMPKWSCYGVLCTICNPGGWPHHVSLVLATQISFCGLEMPPPLSSSLTLITPLPTLEIPTKWNAAKIAERIEPEML